MKIRIVAVSILALLCSCFQKSNPVTTSPAAESVISVGTSFDYSAGGVGQYDLTDSVLRPNLLSIHFDNDVRTFGNSTYILERNGRDNIIRITGSVITNDSVAYDAHIGSSANIQDLAIVSATKAYVTQYGSSSVAIFNPETGTKLAGSIDLSPYVAYAGTDSAAPLPYMGRALSANGKVYVACQRLKAPTGGYIQAADTSLIVVIDAATDRVVKAIRLHFKDPQELSICGGKLYVASVGLWGVNDGGIEAIDLATDTDLGPILDEAALGGDVGSVIVLGDTKGYVVISTPAWTTELHPFDPQAKTVGSKVAGIDAPCTNHMAYDGTYLYVGDRSTNAPGIVTVNPATDAKVGATKNIGLPPNSLAFLKVQ